MWRRNSGCKARPSNAQRVGLWLWRYKREGHRKGARVDGIDYVNRIVYELKPNNPRAVRRGLAQLDRYLNILGAEDWAGVLVLYD